MSAADPNLAPEIVVCVKWCVRPEMVAERPDDARFSGVSESDRAALEVGLVLAEALGTGVTAVSVGPPAAEQALRDAVAVGVARAVRVDASAGLASVDVAAEIAGVAAGARLVICGDASTDRGSGSVPAFVAHRLGIAQALGLVVAELHASPADGDAHLTAVRRLDGGRRERLRVPLPAVISVEGSVATLRRAGLRAALAARSAVIEQRVATHGPLLGAPDVVLDARPFRPRARALPAPRDGDVLARLHALIGTGHDTPHGETVVLDPPAAAARIVHALREWGYLTS